MSDNNLRLRDVWEEIPLRTKAAIGALTVTVLVVVGARDKTEHNARPVPRSTAAATGTTTTAPHITRGIYETDSGTWPIRCEGGHSYKVQPSQTLSGIIASGEVDIHDPATLGRPDLSRDAIVQAVARHADIKDPNVIFAGQSIDLPDSCESDSP